jgi:hypothetical protein
MAYSVDPTGSHSAAGWIAGPPVVLDIVRRTTFLGSFFLEPATFQVDWCRVAPEDDVWRRSRDLKSADSVDSDVIGAHSVWRVKRKSPDQ